MGTRFIRFLTNHAFDRQTDSFIVTRPPCIQCSAVTKTEELKSHWSRPSTGIILLCCSGDYAVGPWLLAQQLLAILYPSVLYTVAL